MKKIFSMTALVLALVLVVHADVYVKMKTHSDAMTIMGQTQPEKDEFSEQWIGDDKFASVSPSQSFIADLKRNVLYIINHSNKSYIETALPLDLSKLLPPEASAMLPMMQMKATVNPTNETKKIGQWNCQGYEATLSIMMMTMKMKTWASTEVPFDINQFNAKIYSSLLKGQMFLDDASVKEMMKIKGLTIASETTGDIMGAKLRSTTEVVEISKKNPPANVYSPPAGYAKKDKFSMEDLQKR